MKRTLFLIMFLTALLGITSVWARVPITQVHQQSEGSDFSGGNGYRDYAAMDNPDYYYAAIKTAPTGVTYRAAGFNPARTKVFAQKQFTDGAITRRELVLMDADGSNEIYISPGDSGEGDIYGYMNPFWSDDGNYIGFLEVHNATPNKVVLYDVSGQTSVYIYEPTETDVANPDFMGNSTSTIVFWAYGPIGGADLHIWDGFTLTNITNTPLYKEYEPVSNADGSVILYWSGETTTEPVNTTHTLTYSGGSWVVDQGFTPIPDTYWSYWSGQDNNNIGVVTGYTTLAGAGTYDIHIYNDSGSYLYDLTGPSYTGGAGQWNFIGFSFEGDNGEILFTSNAGRTTTGRDIIIANPRNALFVDATTGSDTNPGTVEAPFLTIQKAITEVAAGGVITVSAGTYYEQLFIDKELTLLGPNHDKHGTALDRVAEAIIRFPGTIVGDNNLISINSEVPGGEADDVTIKGFLLEGNDLEADAETVGIMNDRSDNALIQNNILQNFSMVSVWNSSYYYSGGWNYGGYISGVKVKDNYITNTGDYFSQYHGVYMQGAYGEVIGNKIENVATGIQIQPYNHPGTGQMTVSGNQIYAYARGLWFNYSENANANWLFSGNTVTGIASPSYDIRANWYGLCVQTFYEGNVAFSGNTVNIGDADNENIYLFSKINATNGVVDMDATFANNTWEKCVVVRFPGRGLIKVPTFYSTIQEGVDAAVSGDVVDVADGIYVEDIIVDKGINLIGPNIGTPGNGTRVPEAIIYPATSNPYGEIVKVQASNVTIDGFKIDGDNHDLTSGYIGTNGADIDAAEAVTVYVDNVNNLTVKNNIIQNVNYFGVTLFGASYSAPSTSGHLVEDNLIRDLGLYDVDPNYSLWGGGVLIYNNQYARIKDNVMTNVRLGIQTGNFSRTNPGDPMYQVIDGNTIQARRRGIFYNLHYIAVPLTLSNNTITALADAHETGWNGIMMSSLSNVSGIATGNVINGAGVTIPTVGYMIWNDQAAPTISGGSVSNVDTGINVNNYEGYNGNAGNTYATLSDVDFSINAGGKGIYVHDNPLNTNGTVAELTIGADVTVTGGAKGVVVEGPQAELVSPLDNLALSTQTGYYFQLIDNPNDIDATEVRFDGVLASDMDTAALAALEAKLYHQIDESPLGLITVSYTDLYVDVPEELIPDNYEQTYSVKAAYIQSLRGFTVQVEIPKADFATKPIDFLIGSGYSGYTMAFLDTLEIHTGTHWVFKVSGAYLGGFTGITGADVELFKFKATSTPNWDNIPAGCNIELPLDEVILKDDKNPYNEIGCLSTTHGWVLIDATEPTITIDNIVGFPDGMTLPIDPDLTVTNGYPSVAVPPLSLDYWDNYNLDYSQYMLVDYGSEPSTVAAFSSSTYLFGPAYDGATNNDLIWTDPDGDLNYAINDLPDGHYTLSFLALDDAGNFVIVNWSFYIDKTATGPIVWDSTIPCRTTANANNSIDLKWANPVGAVKNHIWILSYGDVGTGYTHYPEYEDHSEPTIPAAPNPYNPAVQNGWTRNIVVDPVPATFPYAITGMARGYYYVTIFAEDINGNISVAPVTPFYRESISYWPGDVVATLGSVNVTDISRLTAVWGLEDGDDDWDNEIDVGPSTDYARRSRPCPDNVIDIEDLMMFAMNYNNTVYTFYPRNVPDPNPITIAMHLNTIGDQYEVTLELGENAGFVKGLNIPISYGDGLALQSLEIGDIWPEGSLLLHTDLEGKVTVSISTLGAEPLVLGNGTIATLTFNVVGANAGLGFEHMTARTWDNQEIEIVNNPGASTDNDDLVNVIPDSSYLGKNYPNPFTGSTTIAYGLKEAGSVKLSVFNSRGQLIRTLVNDAKAPGTYQINWNGLDNNNRPVSSGVYFFRMETQGVVKTAKGLLIK